MARQVLMGHARERVEAVANAIEQHRFRELDAPSTLEARVLYDADKLDAIGAIGIARAYAFAGQRQLNLWAAVDPSYANAEPSQVSGRPERERRLYGVFKLARLGRMLTPVASD